MIGLIIMSRLEMAMIVDKAQRNLSAFNSEEQSVIERLGKEYFYDVKKIQLLNKINVADVDTPHGGIPNSTTVAQCVLRRV